MAIFFGFQGSGKSSMASILALAPEWFSDSILLGEQTKELLMLLAGKLIVEISEMGMRGTANAATVKAQISRQVDEGRKVYERSISKQKRRNIFIGTTNDNEPLSDPTGNRRFLPVHVQQEIDLPWLRSNIGQLIGESATLEASGIDFDIPREVWGVAAERAEAVRSESDMEIQLNDWFGETTFTKFAFVSAADLVRLSDITHWNFAATRSRKAIMEKLGFRNMSCNLNGVRSKIWVRGAPDDMRPADVLVLATRYNVDKDAKGQPVVRIQGPTSAILATARLPAPPY